jgi:hypothetical protein
VQGTPNQHEDVPQIFATTLGLGAIANVQEVFK